MTHDGRAAPTRTTAQPGPEAIRVSEVLSALTYELWRRLRAPDLRADLAAVEPADHVVLADETRLEHVAEAFALIVDAKSPGPTTTRAAWRRSRPGSAA